MESTSNTNNQPVENDEDFVIFKRSHFYSVMVMFAFAAGILVGYMAWGRSAASPAVVAQVQAPTQQAQAAAPAAEDQETPTRYDIPTEGFPSLGPDDAEIVIVEFSDYQ